MSDSIIIGADASGAPVRIDIEELLATRLLVQGNSGSGKSHLLRRLLEESAALVQQVVIDPEGDFVTLAEPYGHVVIDGAAYGDAEIAALAARIRQHRASVVLALDGLEIDGQMRCAAQFLSALFDAPREQWYPVLVVVDEAQMFAPAAGGEVSEDVRRASLAAMTNLMCRGRKRGLAGVIATQRLAKLAKNVAAEASNFLMGRTFLDIDMARAADLLGMERRQAEQIRDLERGRFLGLGPAISRRPVAVKVGAAQTRPRSVVMGLMPLPEAGPLDMETLLTADLASEARERPAAPPPLPRAVEAEEIERRITAFDAPLAPQLPELARVSAEEAEAQVRAILLAMAAEDGATYQAPAALFQDFTVRCRIKGLPAQSLDMTQFRRRFSMALAGIVEEADERRADLLALASGVTEDLLAPFLVIAVAAQDEAPCPDDDQLARAYGTSSSGRIRRLLDHLEKIGLIVVRTDFGGRRSISVPHLGLTTGAAQVA